LASSSPVSSCRSKLLTAVKQYSIIVTTNLPFENWPEVLGNQRLTGAALDRLPHRCPIIETKGESYRHKYAKRRAGKAQAAKKKSP
jgi:DNA replication protein DnaC